MSSTSPWSSLYWTSLPHIVVGEAIPVLHPGTSCSHTSERLLDLDWLQCAKLSLLVGYFTGRGLFYLHFEAWDWGPTIYVDP